MIHYEFTYYTLMVEKLKTKINPLVCNFLFSFQFVFSMKEMAKKISSQNLVKDGIQSVYVFIYILYTIHSIHLNNIKYFVVYSHDKLITSLFGFYTYFGFIVPVNFCRIALQ